MANGLTGGLESILGIDADAGSSELKKALAAIQGVQAPTAAQLSLPELQKYVQQGLLTPEQYKAIIADPETYSRSISETNDTSGTSAQKAALQQLGGIVQAGGSTDINKANLLNNIDQTNQAMKASRGAIMSNAQERQASGGGLEFVNQLLNEQGNADIANKGAVNAAANNAQLALNAISQQGQLGGQLQGQANQMSQAQAEAAKQIAEYNSQLQSHANEYNTEQANQAQAANLGEKQRIADTNAGNANYRTEYNAQVPQTVFSDEMSKAGALAGTYGKQADLAQKQAQQGAALTGGIIGAGATLGGGYLAGQAAQKAAPVGKKPPVDPDSYYNPGYAHGGEVSGGKCYAEGGEVHDHDLCMKVGGTVPGEPNVPGDSAQNDTVPARLSPHEIVLPRSVATAPDAPQKAAQFVANTKGLTPSVGSFAEALKMLEENGLELRLHAAQ
jgi:hypothetical protein